jgi:predicted nucleic acid-binding Zn ribbon protein
MGRVVRSERSTRARKKPVPAGVAIGELFDQLGILKTVRQFDVLNMWASVVGEQVAKVTMAQRMEKGVLTVGVATAPWRNGLVLRKREIIQKLNAAVGSTVVLDIRFR